MIKKIDIIKNLAVFKNFKWDNTVKDNNGKVVDFTTINIIYGRNYSGKTTLSRIVRGLETGSISDKYQNHKFKIIFDDNSSISQDRLPDKIHVIRVFNEDFVKDNLSFLKDTSTDGEIKSFAVLGEDNTKLQSEIDFLKAELGSNEEGKENGLYKEELEKEKVFNEAKKNYDEAKERLENKLSSKATGDRKIAIKYKPDLYGDQNYNINKLKTDIEIVRTGYTPITDAKRDELRNLTKENAKNSVPNIQEIEINIKAISENVKNLVEQKVGSSQKIEELVRDAELNRWVKDGRKYHKDRNLKVCSFCGNRISDERWSLLDKHFDEESEKLDKNIEVLITQLSDDIDKFNAGLGINKEAFYSKFQTELSSIEENYNKNLKDKALESINSLISQLRARQKDLFTPHIFKTVEDFTINLSNLYKKYREIEKKSNDYSSKLTTEQSKAKEQLRLDEVYRYIKEIKYCDELKNIESLKTIFKSEELEKTNIEEEINEKKNEINNKQALMHDEGKGAKKVNEYLNNFFGHKYLSLTAKEDSNDLGKHYKFEVSRNEKIAYNLSEGECSLIAFCYFMAKLDDISTHDKKPIIWIDDPVSSLDSNHVFFIYTLIATKIANTNAFEQLFVSTHNLNFLGYLKRMNGKFLRNGRDKQKQYFWINRCFEESNISLMPNYLKDHITEFNYLFKEIHTCSGSETVNNDNFQSFYNFGNNARKFLEIFLFYKFPDETEERIKMEKFFGKGKVPVIFSERINNEYSHLEENVSRGFFPIDVPEMQKVAKVIDNAIKKNDKEQYDALVNSTE